MVSPSVWPLSMTQLLYWRRRSIVASRLCARASWQRLRLPFALFWSLSRRRMGIFSAILRRPSRLLFICNRYRRSSPRLRQRLVVCLPPFHAVVLLAPPLHLVQRRLLLLLPLLPPPPAGEKHWAALLAEARAVRRNDFRRLFLLPHLWPRQWGGGLDVSFMFGRNSALLPPLWTMWKGSSFPSVVLRRSPFLLRRLLRLSRARITWISSTRRWRRCRGREP